MGPIVRVPDEVAEQLEETDLVEAVVLPDAVDQADIELGPPGGVFLLLVETPPSGFGGVRSIIAASRYVTGPRTGPLELIVRDGHGEAHPFAGTSVDDAAIQDHLASAYFGEPGERCPMFPSSA